MVASQNLGHAADRDTCVADRYGRSLLQLGLAGSQRELGAVSLALRVAARGKIDVLAFQAVTFRLEGPFAERAIEVVDFLLRLGDLRGERIQLSGELSDISRLDPDLCSLEVEIVHGVHSHDRVIADAGTILRVLPTLIGAENDLNPV